MPDKFPEAFDRYTDYEHPHDAGVTTFQQLITHFGQWQHKRTSRKQIKAMGRISEDRVGIKPYIRVHISYQRTLKSGEVKTISYDRYRDVTTGRFAKL